MNRPSASIVVLPFRCRAALVRKCSVWISLVFILVGHSLLTVPTVHAANFSEAEALFRSGKLDEAEAVAAVEVERGIWNRRWSELLIRCQLSTGKYSEALTTYEAAIKRYPTSLPLRVLGIKVARYNDLPANAATEKAFIERYLQTGQLRYATADTLVAAGRFFADNGVDARIILKNFFDQVLKTDPSNVEALIATAELAISKGDFKVAAETVSRASSRDIEDARLDHVLAVALRSSDSTAAKLALQKSLDANPTYEPALVLKAEGEIDRELYDQANETLDTILKTNPNSPSAYALKAVLAHLEGNYTEEKTLRKRALKHWPTNPNVDHLIGRKLSDKYRFSEGAHYQRLALTLEPTHIPATFQLAQDLLRLGDAAVGWELAEQVNTQDPYNVVAYNLMTLKDRMDGFETVRASDQTVLPNEPAEKDLESLEFDAPQANSEPGEILIRMDPRERKIYGNEVAKFLNEAKQVLCEKYDLKLDRPVIVEIFPKQSDFAIRTFGLPGGEGFLGVCFGHVITANSPASQGARPSNWKSVLWHEFCHVITLTKTSNRMPRWLSEGISVYEERLRDPRWGQSMTAQYREMILGEDFTPVSQLSGAFLSPPSPSHLQFAYFESSLVVEFIVNEYGAEKLNAVLDALRQGTPINAALAEHIAPIERLEAGFTEFAKTAANAFGKELKFDRYEAPENGSEEDAIDWANDNPDNYWARMTLARSAFKKGDISNTVEHLEFLRESDAATGEQEGVLELLAECYKQLDDQEKEREILNVLFSISPDALPSLERFIEMETLRNNWDSVRTTAVSALEIQPFSTQIHRALVSACQELDQSEDAYGSLLALEAMEPVDIAGLKFQLAQSRSAAGDSDAAKEYLVDALLIAPRYRDAHHLLLELSNPKPEGATPPNDSESKNAQQEQPEAVESDESASDANSKSDANSNTSGDSSK